MKALTVYRPFAGAIVSLGKPVENRDWPPPAWLIGKRIALHAGKRWDAEGAEWILDAGLATPDDLRPELQPAGAVVAVVRIAGWVEGEPALFRDRPGVLQAFRGRLNRERALDLVSSPWFVGRFGWVPDEIVALAEPVFCRGAQGLWDLPANVEARVLAQVGGGAA